MTVIVANKLIERRSSLSDITIQSLAFIDGGTQWLAWAMLNPMTNYRVVDEASLLAEVQLGLHGSPLTLLPQVGLWVSPVKLMSLSPGDLRTLGLVETGDTSPNVLQQMQRILQANQLFTAAQLRGANDFLQQLGVQNAPVFQVLDFYDRVALLDLAALSLGQDATEPDQLRHEAAVFAVEQARTVPEFCDYFHIYVAHAERMDALNGNAAMRDQLVNQAVQTLLPLAFGALDCPQLAKRLMSPDEVEHSLHNLLARGYKIGFSRLSQVVLQIVTQTVFTAESGTDAARLFDLYLAAAKSFLSVNRLQSGRLGQDGASLTFPMHSDDQQALLHVSASGVLSLRAFGARKDSTPPVSPTTTDQPE